AAVVPPARPDCSHALATRRGQRTQSAPLRPECRTCGRRLRGARQGGGQLRPRPVLVDMNSALQGTLQGTNCDQRNSGDRAWWQRRDAGSTATAPARTVRATSTAARRKDQVEE